MEIDRERRMDMRGGAEPLPIDAVLPALVDGLRQHRRAVLTAAPGAGKTTRAPAALLHSGLVGADMVVVVEPRRLAARTAAARVAWELGAVLGDEVGYEVRFDRRSSRRTRLLFVTDGVFLRMAADDPFLDGIGAVVFDEFHERSLNVDLAAGMARRIAEQARPELLVLTMSATLDPGPVADFWAPCPVFDCPGRAFPVDIRHRGDDRRPLTLQMADAVADALADASGDLLAFLPGAGEILDLQRGLRTRLGDGCAVLPLFGDMPAEQQDAVFAPRRGRKVILATNVAETSVTIDGVTIVVDSGLSRQASFDAGRGVNRLERRRISLASADQRAGRAGRTAPGVCHRLWSKADERLFDAKTLPEVARLDLGGAVLLLRCWGERDPADFPWLTPPRPDALAHAELLLMRLGALRDGLPTPLGRAMQRLPLEPRLSRMMFAAHEAGMTAAGARLAALLGERPPFLQEDSRPAPPPRTTSDVVDMLEALSGFESAGTRHSRFGEIHDGRVRGILDVARQVERALAPAGAAGPADAPSAPASRLAAGIRPSAARTTRGRHVDEAALRRVLLIAFPDRVARRRSADGREAVMTGGRGVTLAAESGVDAELFVVVDAVADARGTRVRLASAIDRDWLAADLIATSDELVFDGPRQRVVGRRVTRYLDLVIDQRETPVTDDAAAARTLADAALAHGCHVYLQDDATQRQLGRIDFLKRQMPEASWPSTDDAGTVRPWLERAAYGKRTLPELRQADWAAIILESLSPDCRRQLDREAPETLKLGNGAKAKVGYAIGQRPVIAMRIQELFGVAETPTLAGGRTTPVMHLLAPNRRAQQVTDDLRSFWNGAYQIVRKELRARYPKHAWPEDPWTTPPARSR